MCCGQRWFDLLHCALASGAVYCNRSCLCVCGARAGGRAVSVTTITRNCVHRLHQTGSVGAGSDHLQLIRFWQSCTPGKGVCGGAKIFGSALVQPARSVCVSPSAFFICLIVLLLAICLTLLAASVPADYHVLKLL